MPKLHFSTPGERLAHFQKESTRRGDLLLALANVATLVLLGVAIWIFLTYTTDVGSAILSFTHSH